MNFRRIDGNFPSPGYLLVFCSVIQFSRHIAHNLSNHRNRKSILIVSGKAIPTVSNELIDSNATDTRVILCLHVYRRCDFSKMSHRQSEGKLTRVTNLAQVRQQHCILSQII